MYPTMRREGLLLSNRHTPLPAPSSSGPLGSDAQSGVTSHAESGSGPKGSARSGTSFARFSLSLVASDAQIGATSPVRERSRVRVPPVLWAVAQLAERLCTSIARFSLALFADDAQAGVTSGSNPGRGFLRKGTPRVPGMGLRRSVLVGSHWKG